MLLFTKWKFKFYNIISFISFRQLNTEKSSFVKFSNDRILKLAYGKLSKIADGSCVANIGDTNVMVTAVSNTNKPSLNSGFLPLLVDYREKSSAGGRIPTNYFRRDLNPSEREILISRAIDRSIRNSFPPGYFYETQIICNVLSVDYINDPDVVALNSAFAALHLSNIPWNGPIGSTRISLLNNQIIINPTRKELKNSVFNIICTSNEKKNIIMLEASSNEPTETKLILNMIESALNENLKIIDAIKFLKQTCNIEKRTIEKYFLPSEDLIKTSYVISSSKLRQVFEDHSLNKFERDNEINLIKDNTINQLKDHYSQEELLILNNSFIRAIKSTYCNYVFETNSRCDGRKLDNVRPLYSERNLYKPLHGSALFQRGQTQVLATVTFDSPESALKLNNLGMIDEVKEKNFMLHYEFPPYATRDIGRVNLIGRREIGHGNLAEKSIRPLLPDNIDFTIRLTTEVFESNGSSSMASICAGSIALMDSGINLKEHVAGIAMGLIMKKDTNEYKILTDILGFEDFFGELDFKIAGTKTHLTALQLDCKLENGLEFNIIKQVLIKAQKARIHLIDHMNSIIDRPNQNKSNLPVLEKIEVLPYKKSHLIGLGGINLKKLKAQIGVTITQESDTSNNFIVFAPNQEAMNEAKEWINEKLFELEDINLDFGAIYTVKIVKIEERGVLVKIHPKFPSIFLKNQELDKKHIKHASVLGFKEGDEIQVKYFGRDPANGEIRISRRILQLTQPSVKNFIKDK